MSDAVALLSTPGASIKALGALLILLGALILWRAHRSKNRIDFAHFLLDDEGKTSLRKFGELLAMLTSTWIVLYLATVEQLSETVFTMYLIVWAVRSAVGPLIGAKASAITEQAGAHPNGGG